MTKMERAQKEINGKLVVYEHSRLPIRLDAILVWPPGGEQVSVKPYGYTPSEVSEIMVAGGINWATEDECADPHFCLASNSEDESLGILERIASIPDGGVYNISKLISGYKASFDSPSCPYG